MSSSIPFVFNDSVCLHRFRASASASAPASGRLRDDGIPRNFRSAECLYLEGSLLKECSFFHLRECPFFLHRRQKKSATGVAFFFFKSGHRMSRNSGPKRMSDPKSHLTSPVRSHLASPARSHLASPREKTFISLPPLCVFSAEITTQLDEKYRIFMGRPKHERSTDRGTSGRTTEAQVISGRPTEPEAVGSRK